MTIGALAKSVGVPTTTVRFYERAGLLRPSHRSAGNYREYTDESVQRLRFIKSSQSVGLSVKDVKDLLAVTDADDSPCDEVQSLLQRRLTDVRQRMKDLRRIEKTLARALANCCTPNDPGLCRGAGKTACKPACNKN
jgi:MerR family mercuric resistance operon transcriptional regulator